MTRHIDVSMSLGQVQDTGNYDGKKQVGETGEGKQVKGVG